MIRFADRSLPYSLDRWSGISCSYPVQVKIFLIVFFNKLNSFLFVLISNCFVFHFQRFTQFTEIGLKATLDDLFTIRVFFYSLPVLTSLHPIFPVSRWSSISHSRSLYLVCKWKCAYEKVEKLTLVFKKATKKKTITLFNVLYWFEVSVLIPGFHFFKYISLVL